MRYVILKDTIDYESELKAIGELKEAVAGKLKIKEEAAEEIRKLELSIADLKTKLQDEGFGAEKINEYLNHYFGHQGLTLVPDEDAERPGVFFKIKRGDEEAHNLSEGECSLVSFCYFIASLEEVNTKGKELIIWIDDPVSSLDYNHVFFIFSLIESVIARPKNYKQLFISTHNLDFFKYLKAISGSGRRNAGYFLIEKLSETASTIKVMPDYLKNYVTEFNYLFHQIYKCSQAENAGREHECFYNFGNNLRKFLDAYLFYKYPAKGKIHDKLKCF
jgi:wobble nucleotide-excising tRNase